MNIVLMNGGLGNQIGQFLFLRWLERESGMLSLVDDSSFFGKNIEHNGYELERIFGIRLHRLSQYTEKVVWEKMISEYEKGRSIPQQLHDMGEKIIFFYETDDFSYDGVAREIDMLHIPVVAEGTAYYHVYATDYIYTNSIYMQMGESIRRELKFPPLLDGTANAYYEKKIMSTDNSVAVHVRRGDMAVLGRAKPNQYYADCIAEAERVTGGRARYFLFSDDMDYCRTHWRALGLEHIADRLMLMEGNRKENAYIDMQLMSLCRYFIVSASAFSHNAYLFSCIEDKKVILPE